MNYNSIITILAIVIAIVIFFMYVIWFIPFNKDNLIHTQDQLVAHDAKALVVTCMDFRLIDDAVRYLNKTGYNNNYDQFILAGSTLGYNQSKYNDWISTLDAHIKLSIQLHKINEVIFIDHMDCGAYKMFYKENNLTPENELRLHKDNFIKIKKTFKHKYPTLTIKTMLMDLYGNMIIQ